MFSRSSIPSNVLETLICIECKNYLSVFPVYVCENSGALCGRCKVTEEEKFTRNESYEAIAQFLAFPCRYFNSGCEYYLTPEKIELHEPCCEYRHECPNKNSLKCDWNGAKEDIPQHFEERHTDLILKEPKFELNFVRSQNEHVLLQKDDEWFMIKKETDSGKGMFSCAVEHIKINKSSPSPNYMLYIESGKDYCYSWPIKSTCDTEKENSHYLSCDVFQKELGNITMPTIIDIQFFSERTGKKQERGSIEASQIMDGITSRLKCGRCKNYMYYGIFQCYKCHVFCQTCKDRGPVYDSTFCVVCYSMSNYEVTRNIVLENLANQVKYPCKFYISGCEDICNLKEIREHEIRCDFRKFHCPLSCDWNGNKIQLVEHIKNVHNSDIKCEKVNVLFTDSEADAFKGTFLIKLHKKIFKLYYKYVAEHFCWYTELIGDANESRNYKFTVDVTDTSNSNIFCHFTALVEPLTEARDTDKHLIGKTQLAAFAPTITCPLQLKLLKMKNFLTLFAMVGWLVASNLNRY